MNNIIYTGEEILSLFDNIQNDEFENSKFILMTIDKKELYNKHIPCTKVKNLKTYSEWKTDEDNYDNWHIENIEGMIECVREGGILPPIIVDKNLGIYDGMHRLTAYSMMNEIKEIEIFKEV